MKTMRELALFTNSSMHFRVRNMAPSENITGLTAVNVYELEVEVLIS